MTRSGFWSHPSLAGTDIPVGLQLSLGEGDTPIEPCADEPSLLLKREDANPSGSHKDRAACYQVARAASRGDSAVVISSSGNAAIATSRYAAAHGLDALIFVHPDTEPAKLAAIDGATTTLVVTARTINSAKRVSVALRVPNLRPSVHDDALCGYATLGDELIDADIDTLVIFATSGATAIAAGQVLQRERPDVQLHFVQGEGNAQLAAPASAGDIPDTANSPAAAGRLGVRRSRRGDQLLEVVAATGGLGWVASHDDVAQARTRLIELGIESGDESAANLAIASRLVEQGRKVACIISGAPPHPTSTGPLRVVHADDEWHAIDQLQAHFPALADAARPRTAPVQSTE